MAQTFSQLLKEINRRSVGRVAIAYVVVGWLLAQVAEFATETFGAPEWVLRVFVVFLVLGLPVAVLLAWAFDLTVVRTAEKPREGEAAQSTSTGRRIVFVTFVLVTVSAAAWFQVYGPDPESSPVFPGSQSADSATVQPRHFDLLFPDDAPLALIGAAELGNGKPAFAISPSGELVVYVGADGNGYQLYLRNLVTGETTSIQGTRGAYHPFFSPNSAWIGFFVGNNLYKVHTAGGDPVFLSEATNSVGADWTMDDQILVSIEEGEKVVSIPASGGPAVDVYTEQRTMYLNAIHGYERLLAAERIVDLETGEGVSLNVRSDDIRFAGGYLFFASQGSLFASRFDIEAGAVMSNPVPVITGVRTEIWGAAQWSASSNGTLIYMPGGDARISPVNWVSPNREEQIDLPVRIRGTLEISPEGGRMAVLESNYLEFDIWIYNFSDGTSTKLTTDGNNSGPIFWAPDGLSVYYQKIDDGQQRTYRTALNSQNPAESVLPVDYGNSATSVTQDGRLLGVHGPGGIGVYDLVEGKSTDIPSASTNDWGTAIEPGGRAVVYTSSSAGAYHTYLQPVPPTGDLFQLSRDGGAEEPRWSRDGSKVYFRSGSRIMEVDVTLEPNVSIGQPRVFYAGVFENVGGRSYDIHPDGERALVIRSDDLASSVRVIANWFTEVEQIIAEDERRQ